MEGVPIEKLISLLPVIATGSAVGYLHALLRSKNFRSRISIILFISILISVLLVLTLKLSDMIGALYMYYSLLASVVGISIVIFFDRILYRIGFLSILFGFLNTMILIFISKIKMKDIEVGYTYLFLIGLAFFLGFQIKNLKKKNEKIITNRGK